MKKRSELIFSLVLVPIDYAMMIVGFVAAYFYRAGSTKPLAYDVGGYEYLRYLVILLPIWVFIFAILGLYSLESTRRRIDEFVKVFIASACGVMALVVMDFFNTRPIFPSKSIIIYGFAFTVLLVSIARLIVSIVQRILFHYGIGVHHVLILAPQKLIAELRAGLGKGFRVLNDDLDSKDFRSLSTAELTSLHQKAHIDEIIHLHTGGQRDVELINFCQQHQVAYRFVPNVVGLYSMNVQTALYGGVPVLELKTTPLEGWGRILKRIVDFFTSLIGVIVLSPLFLLIALIIKITDPGPVFYLDERLSRTGRKIKIYKFRSMKAEYCDGGKFGSKTREEVIASFGDPELVEEFRKYQKLKKDPRVSAIGRFTRKTSIDELAQLFNVLKGDLSLVGPRPIVENELERYGELGGKFLTIKPGLTGLWQVSGRNDISYKERVELDIYYVENWSLWMDLVILWRTLGVVVRGRGY
jgi:exopolysaccharide biosynthesis polyprenyl glycosylphosphotransferase